MKMDREDKRRRQRDKNTTSTDVGVASRVVDKSAGSWQLFRGVDAARRAVVLKREHEAHLVLAGRLIALSAVNSSPW